MKILITGGAGFIGSNLAIHLTNKYPDYEITVFDALTYCGSKDNLSEIWDKPNFKFIKGDITCMMNFVKSINCDVVINLAAETHVDNSISNSTPFIMTNCLGVKQVLDFCRTKAVKILHFSTDEVYGPSIDGHRFTEDERLSPGNPYSASKAFGDHLLRAYHNTYGLQYIIVRPANNYGPRQFGEKFIPTIIRSILNDESIPVFGSGKAKRAWMYVQDTCRYITAILHTPKEYWDIDEIVNLGSEFSRTNLWIADYIRNNIFKRTGKKGTIEFVDDRLGHDMDYRIDLLGAEGFMDGESTPWEEGIDKTITWYLENL
jgi:dTDP-glucose 4,6-dehydratase